jgi:deoxyadenosine/deoxycytidine kinase
MIVTIEGNIGAGKSTLLSLIRENIPCIDGKRVVVLTEKVDEWLGLVDPSSGKSIFDLFYGDPKQYAYVFQTYVLLSRVKNLSEVVRDNADAIVICERGCMTDCVVFAKSMHDGGMLSDIEWMVYQAWHRAICETVPIPIDGQIYLRATPSICFGRVSHRARQGEDNIAAEYIQDLHDRHDKWLLEGGRPMPTHVLDADADLVNDKDARGEAIVRLIDFIRDLMKPMTGMPT